MTTKSRKRTKPRSSSSARRSNGLDWTQLPDEKLLDLRICDLGVRIEGTPLEERIERLYEELESRDINFHPRCWLSDDWFSPDRVPGIAIPFYLAHPRLMRLERKQILEVEGGTEAWCLRILRHEAGHALDTAFRLHRRHRWREMFGKNSEPYPDYYHPKPYSKSYVLHLDMWYAQSHPAEDFAETFAVWLRPRSRWRSQYRGWPVMKKLAFVDTMMTGLCGKKPLVASRALVDPVHRVRKTLRKHYQEKRARYEIERPNFYDRELRRLFSDAPEHARRPTAASFLRRIRPELRRVVAHWTGQYQYTIDQVLKEMIECCRERRLRLARPEAEAKRDTMVMLAVQTVNYLHNGHHRVTL